MQQVVGTAVVERSKVLAAVREVHGLKPALGILFQNLNSITINQLRLPFLKFEALYQHRWRAPRKNMFEGRDCPEKKRKNSSQFKQTSSGNEEK